MRKEKPIRCRSGQVRLGIFSRYIDPHNDKALASKEALEYWSPVDWYNGGMEHTTLHLLLQPFLA